MTWKGTACFHKGTVFLLLNTDYFNVEIDPKCVVDILGLGIEILGILSLV